MDFAKCIVILQCKTMGTTKNEIFTEEQNELSILLKALAHPARLAILERILMSSNCLARTLIMDLGLAQSTISQHLKELKNMKIINNDNQGGVVSYKIDCRTWKQLKIQLEYFFESFNRSKNSS